MWPQVKRIILGLIFFYNINTTPGHKIILHMHEVEPVLGFQFTAVNQMHITPCCS